VPPAVYEKSDFEFMTPSEITDSYPRMSTLNVPFSGFWADEDLNLSASLGNELQQEAFEQLNGLKGIMDKCRDLGLKKDWQYLQTCDHFYYMGTNYFAESDTYSGINPYKSPYDAFINYMNVLNDFAIRLNLASSPMQFSGYRDQNEKLISII
jgi:alpha-amylase